MCVFLAIFLVDLAFVLYFVPFVIKSFFTKVTFIGLVFVMNFFYVARHSPFIISKVLTLITIISSGLIMNNFYMPIQNGLI